MTKFSDQLDRTFFSLSDPTRRAILGRLRNGPASVGELSEPFDIALPTLLKHVRVLEESGLVSSEKVGRVRTCRLETNALRAGEEWLRQHVMGWEMRLDRLERHIKRKKEGNRGNG